MTAKPYIGRFAPSPTGDLHFGSLVAAVGSCLQARTSEGQWRVRVEDIDPPREVPGSAEGILRELARLGMTQDGPVLFQSQRMEAYREACMRLIANGRAYYCRCSRKMLPEEGVYPGTCRNARVEASEVKRLRFRVEEPIYAFEDKVMGRFEQDLANEVGDFVIQRPDGLPAYQLAVVVDDAWQSITEVVRGADLLDSTPRQIALQKALGLPTPSYCHLPLAILPDGSKLSKRLRSDPTSAYEPADAVRQALVFLGQTPPTKLELDQLWSWAIAHWDISRVPRRSAVPASFLY